jgi:thiamine pyrophosphate-dependent acetolactate synthase large subunit-like protein
VRDRLNVAIVLCNDGSFGAEHIQFTSKNMSPSMSLTNPPDFTSMAKSAGLVACRVSDPAELDAALTLLAKGTGPRLVELRLDPDLIPID